MTDSAVLLPIDHLREALASTARAVSSSEAITAKLAELAARTEHAEETLFRLEESLQSASGLRELGELSEEALVAARASRDAARERVGALRSARAVLAARDAAAIEEIARCQRTELLCASVAIAERVAVRRTRIRDLVVDLALEIRQFVREEELSRCRGDHAQGGFLTGTSLERVMGNPGDLMLANGVRADFTVAIGGDSIDTQARHFMSAREALTVLEASK